MIITRSPLRISLGGGGTDLPSYYEKHEGELVAGAINKYVYIVLQEAFIKKTMLRYSHIEHVDHISEINHPIFREVLRAAGYSNEKIEITSFADVPAGTGLGSSGSFTTALIKAILTSQKISQTKSYLAEAACRIELDILKEPIGKQDQYIAAYGGITHFVYHQDGTVTATPVKLSADTYEELHDNLLLFSTQTTRVASDILQDQDSRSRQDDSSMVDNLHFTKEIGRLSLQALTQGNLTEFGNLLHQHWEHKKSRSKAISNPDIDELYALGRQNGALGGKIIGAGGGGFMMFYTDSPPRLRTAMKSRGIKELRFSFDFEGSKVILGD